MALTKYKLGPLIELQDVRNTEGKYTVDDVRGISTEKDFIETKANLDGVSLDSYKIVQSNEFAYVADTSRRGDKIALALNTQGEILISSIYTVFRVKRTDLLLSDFLFIYFNRPEFDRYARFNSWGSARETFNWEDMCDIELELPSIEIQQKYVNIYKAMVENQKSYERGLDDLKLTYEGLLNEYKHKASRKSIGNILQEIDCRNVKNKIIDVQGINIQKQFMPTVANTLDVDLSKYKVVHKGQFAFSGMQTGRDECIRIALFDEDNPVIISPAYTVLEPKDDSVCPEYLMVWFLRKETDRLGWFLSDASIRTNLDLERFYEIEIPVPDINIQRDIANIYKVYLERKSINEKLKEQIKNICPILIKGSIEEAKKEA